MTLQEIATAIALIPGWKAKLRKNDIEVLMDTEGKRGWIVAGYVLPTGPDNALKHAMRYDVEMKRLFA